MKSNRKTNILGKKKKRVKSDWHANPDKMPQRCPSSETFCMSSWNTINKKNAYLKHNMPNYHKRESSRWNKYYEKLYSPLGRHIKQSEHAAECIEKVSKLVNPYRFTICNIARVSNAYCLLSKTSEGQDCSVNRLPKGYEKKWQKCDMNNISIQFSHFGENILNIMISNLASKNTL